MKRSGQAMVLGLLLLLPATMFVSLIFNVSLLIGHKQQLQHAADRAAASGALLKADLVSSLAWINIALSDLYAQTQHHAVTTVVAGTIAEIEDWGLNGLQVEYPSETAYWASHPTHPVSASLPPPADEIGGDGAIVRYQNIYSEVGNELQQYDLWRDRLETMQANIASLGQELIKREIFRTAYVNLGIPEPLETEDDSFDGLIHINLFPYNTQLVPLGTVSESWLITQLAHGGWQLEDLLGNIASVSFTDEGVYYVLTDIDDNIQSYKVKFIEPDGVQISDEYDTLFLMQWDSLNKDWQVISQLGGFFISLGDHGGIRIKKNYDVELRRNPITGFLQYYENDQWVDAPSDMDLGDGIEVPVESNTIIIFGQAFTLTQSSHLKTFVGPNLTANIDPLDSQFWIEGNLTGLTQIEFHVPGELNINGWSVPEDVSGQWKLSDTMRDRLSEEGASQWVYEIASQDSDIQRDNNNHRFAIDHSLDVFGSLFNTDGKASSWLYDSRSGGPGWYNSATGTVASTPLDSAEHYHRTLSCWHPHDAHCPTHGQACPGEPGITDNFSSQIDGGWHDPNDFDNWVVCYLCDQIDYNFDGESDVRRYVEDNKFILNHSISNSRLRQEGDPTHWDVTIPMRLVLTPDFFLWGINVAVHSRLSPWDNFMMSSFFTETLWSPIATASARLGFVDPETRKIIFRFDDLDELHDWVDNSPQNLTMTEWISMLVSTRTQIRLDDLELENTWLTQFPISDSGAIALLKRHLEHDEHYPSQWRHKWDAPHPSGDRSEALYGENTQGEHWDYQNIDLERWIKH